MRKRFVIHEHHATRLHFDLRLEIGGVLRSWAVPKGLSMNPHDRRLAVAVPDHPIGYIDYEGRISEGSYGAGDVRIWDSGSYENTGDPAAQLENGKLIIEFFGIKVRGEFALIKMARDERNWLIIKADDRFADREWKLVTVLPPAQ